MSAGSKARRGDARTAARAVQKRGLQIFLLAFVFRFQSFVLSQGESWTLLKVDILNVMGPSIVAAAALWGWTRTTKGRLVGFALVTAAFVWLAPAVRGWDALGALPNSLEAYLRPIPGLSNFTFFPWTGFLMAGAFVGVLLDQAPEEERDRRLNLSFLAGGLLLAFLAYRSSFLPPVDARSRFWTTSSSFFFIRLGLMVAAMGVAWLWERRPTLRLRSGQAPPLRSGPAPGRWSPLQVLGRSSLFIYWIHVEIVYGLVSLPLHRAFSLAGAWAALGAFCLLMLAAAIGKDWTIRKFRSGNSLRNQLSRSAQPLMF
jgi:uncharacterized membrane protein